MPTVIEAEILIVNAQYNDLQSAGLHSGDKEKVQRVLNAGGVVIVFVGRCEPFHIDNLVGMPHEMALGQGLSPETSVRPTSADSISVIFSRFGNRVSIARRLYAKSYDVVSVYEELDKRGVEVVAVHTNGNLPVAVMSRVGNGIQLFLPYFHELEPIVQVLLHDVLPDIKADLFEKRPEDWLNDARYLLPSIQAVKQEREGEVKRHADVLQEIDVRLKSALELEQKPLNNLLTTSGDELKSAVVSCLKLVDFGMIDVDEYWKDKDPSRQREEDLWLYADRDNTDPAKSPFVLAEVKSSRRGGATDDDCGTITRYVNRRIREFRNPEIKGMLIINHFYGFPAHLRKSAFSSKQVSDAVHAGNCLATTFDLFRLVRATKGGKTTPEEVRKLLQKTVGALVVPTDID